MTVLLGVPNTGMFPWQFVHSAFSLQTPKGSSWQFLSRALIYVAREQIAEYAVKNDFTHLFFLDSDMTLMPDTINRLLERDVDIVSGMAFKRSAPYQPCFYEKCRSKPDNKYELEYIKEWPKDTLLEVEGVGMACCLIKTDVFRNIQQPWFHPLPVFGEDLSFCLRARDNGYKIYVDTNVNTGHVGTCIVEELTYKAYLNAANKEAIEVKGGIMND